MPLRYIEPATTQGEGITVSLCALLGSTVLACIACDQTIGMWQLGLAPGIGVGLFAAVGIYIRGQWKCGINRVAVKRRFGKPTGAIATNGNLWAFPWVEDFKYDAPGPNLIFTLEMDGEEIDAQDETTLYFGQSGKKNAIQVRVFDPTLFIAAENPQKALNDAYLEQARIVFGQASFAVGIKNEKALFSEFLMLPIDATPANPFRAKLANLMVNVSDDDKAPPVNLYSSPEAIDTIMEGAGVFRRKARAWGIEVVNVFTPNVRLNPAIEGAAAKKQMAHEEMRTLQIKVDGVKMRTKEYAKETGASPDRASAAVLALTGQKVDIKDESIRYPGIPEAIATGAEAIAKAFASRQNGRRT